MNCRAAATYLPVMADDGRLWHIGMIYRYDVFKQRLQARGTETPWRVTVVKMMKLFAKKNRLLGDAAAPL